MNRADLIGRVGRDPEVRRTNSGAAVTSFSLATSDRWRDKATGEKRESTEWHNVVCFNENLGKVMEAHVKKGSLIRISGKIQTREFTDRDGNKRKATEIVMQSFNGELEFLGDKPDRPAPDPDSYGQRRVTEKKDDLRQRSEIRDIIDDDIPF